MPTLSEKRLTLTMLRRLTRRAIVTPSTAFGNCGHYPTLSPLASWVTVRGHHVRFCAPLGRAMLPLTGQSFLMKP